MPIELGTPEEGIVYTERAGAYGVVIREGQILIEKARRGYFLPGGGIEAGESIEEALHREFQEETGYTLLKFEPIGSAVEWLSLPEERIFQKKIGHFFIVELGEKGEPTYADGHVFPCDWYPVEAMQNELFLLSQRWGVAQVLHRITHGK